MIGTIQKKEFSKNGAPKFQISGTWYFLNRNCDPQDFPPGTSVEFESEEFGEDRGRGRPKAVKKWRVAQASSGSNGKASTQTQAPSTVTDVDVLRSVSNVVGSACASGTVKSPEELEKWFVAAFAGFTRRRSNAKADPEFNDELPETFYGGEEPPMQEPNW